MRQLLFLFLLIGFNASAAFTEFYCVNTAGACGSNVFAGSTTSTTPAYSSFNGNWDGTSVYTPTDGSTPASTVSAGDWASVYPDNEIITKYIARVITVAAGVNGAITLSTVAIAGTAPSSSANARTIRIGGAWHGPGTRDQVGGQGGSTNYFPFDFVTLALTNTSSTPPRINFKNGTAYTVTNSITHSKQGPVWFEGYASTVGDGGLAQIDGGGSGASYTIMNQTGNRTIFRSIHFYRNGSTGVNQGVSGGALAAYINCIFDSMRGGGYNSGAVTTLISCEARSNNISNTANKGGFVSAASDRYYFCNVHHNAGSASSGFYLGGGAGTATIQNCNSWSNGLNGVTVAAPSDWFINGLNAYNNQGSGIDITSTSASFGAIINSCFFTNVVYGINSSGSSATAGRICPIYNCIFGTGSMTNTSGSIADAVLIGSLVAMPTNNIILYTAHDTPWSNPDAGDFTVKAGALSKAVGYAAFVPSTTLSYPDIGATQAADTNTTATAGGSYTFAQ